MKIATILSILFACSTTLAHNPLKRMHTKVSLNALLSLRHGFTQKQVEDLLKVRGYHQFTAVLSNSTVRCVTYFRNDLSGEYYLVFLNRQLSKICIPPPFEMRLVPYGDGADMYMGRVLGNHETRINAVLQAEDMIGPKLTALVPQATSPPKESVAMRKTDAGRWIF